MNSREQSKMCKHIKNMNNEKDTSLVIGNGKNKTRIIFARADKDDVKRITSLSDKDLIREFWGMEETVHGFCCYSVRDVQLLFILEEEMVSRGFENKIEEIIHKVEETDYEKILNDYAEDKL